MKNSDIALILLRILSVYFLLPALSIVSTSLQAKDFSDNLLIPQTTVMLILAIILWFIAPFIAMLMVKNLEKPLNAKIYKNKTHVEGSIFMTIGLILVVMSLPGLIFNFAYFNTNGMEHLDEATRTMVNASQNGMTASYIFKLITGIFLVVFSENIVNSIINLRTKLGLKKI